MISFSVVTELHSLQTWLTIEYFLRYVAWAMKMRLQVDLLLERVDGSLELSGQLEDSGTLLVEA